MSAPSGRRRLGLGTRILLGMAVGAALGAALGERIVVVEPAGDLFIRLLLLTAVPLVFFNLLAGLTTLTDLGTFGRLAVRAVVYFVATTAVALLLGLAAMALLRPGAGMALAGRPEGPVQAPPTVAEVLLDLFPTNVFRAFSEGNVAQLVVVAVLLGVSTLFLPEGPRDRLRGAYTDLADLFRRLVDLILAVAPYGIGALMAVAVGRHGALLFGPMAGFVGGVWGAQLAMAGLYVGLLGFLTRRGPVSFLRETGAVWATTAATTSSLASLSVAMEAAGRMGLPRPVYAFTLPLGAQLNKDGTAVMLIAVVAFTAQAAGVTLTLAEHVPILLMAFLLSAGSGGIPGGGLVVALVLVQAFGLPLEAAVLVGGIYRLVDMGNTTLNVMGDLVGTVILAERAPLREGMPAPGASGRPEGAEAGP